MTAPDDTDAFRLKLGLLASTPSPHPACTVPQIANHLRLPRPIQSARPMLGLLPYIILAPAASDLLARPRRRPRPAHARSRTICAPIKMSGSSSRPSSAGIWSSPLVGVKSSSPPRHFSPLVGLCSGPVSTAHVHARTLFSTGQLDTTVISQGILMRPALSEDNADKSLASMVAAPPAIPCACGTTCGRIGRSRSIGRSLWVRFRVGGNDHSLDARILGAVIGVDIVNIFLWAYITGVVERLEPAAGERESRASSGLFGFLRRRKSTPPSPSSSKGGNGSLVVTSV